MRHRSVKSAPDPLRTFKKRAFKKSAAIGIGTHVRSADRPPIARIRAKKGGRRTKASGRRKKNETKKKEKKKTRSGNSEIPFARRVPYRVALRAYVFSDDSLSSPSLAASRSPPLARGQRVSPFNANRALYIRIRARARERRARIMDREARGDSATSRPRACVRGTRAAASSHTRVFTRGRYRCSGNVRGATLRFFAADFFDATPMTFALHPRRSISAH